jgi:hypothetical protein
MQQRLFLHHFCCLVLGIRSSRAASRARRFWSSSMRPCIRRDAARRSSKGSSRGTGSVVR